MRHSFLHRTLSAFAALSLLLTAKPLHAAATFAAERTPACSVSEVSLASDAGTTDAAVATEARAALSSHGLSHGVPCEPGPCSMSFMTCAAGACMSLAPPLEGALSTLPSGLSGAPALGAENGLSSAPSGILTPPPRG